MTVITLAQPALTDSVGARTDETAPPGVPHDACVPTRSDWPQEEFFAWLDATKRRLGLSSDYKLAEHLGIGHTLISGWRNGRQRPSWEILIQLGHVLGEEPRRLWVLAGLCSAVDAGLADDDTAPRLLLPEEIATLVELYGRDDLDDADRKLVLRQVRMVTAGVLAELDESRHRQSAI